MTDRRIALLVANYTYEDEDLSQLIAPAQDAEALAQVLRDTDIGDFEVQILLNEPSYKVREEIEALFDDRQRTDLVLLYISGHGLKDSAGRLYFAITDTRRKRLRSTGISASFVNDVMLHSRSRRQVLLLDCCYSGAFARGLTVRADKDVGTGEYFKQGRGQVVLTASDALQYAFEGDEVTGEGVRSVFTHTLIEGLQTGGADLDRDGLITIHELYDYTYGRVTDMMPEQQPRQWTFDLQGDLVIARNPNPVVKPAELPADLQQVIESRYAGVRFGAVQELDQLLQGSDEALAQAARVALEGLVDDDSRSVSAAAMEALGQIVEPSSKPASAKPKEQAKVQVQPAPAKIRATKPKAKPAPSDVLTISSPISLELLRVPAGEFLMGSDSKKDKDATDDEQPQHTLYLPDYYVARTPVTNAHYAAFVQATKHREPDHWKNGTIPNGKDEHPVVYVGWEDAVAFCQWVSQETGQPFRLPTEAEWEKAARGAEGWIYPWGNDWDAKRCNTREDGPGDTTPVGRYSPDGDSPYGAVDMAGNIWEWCATKWGKAYPYDVGEDEWAPEYLKETGVRVLRGGSWVFTQDNARCACRGRDFSAVGYGYWGCRVVVSPSS